MLLEFPRYGGVRDEPSASQQEAFECHVGFFFVIYKNASVLLSDVRKFCFCKSAGSLSCTGF